MCESLELHVSVKHSLDSLTRECVYRNSMRAARHCLACKTMLHYTLTCVCDIHHDGQNTIDLWLACCLVWGGFD